MKKGIIKIFFLLGAVFFVSNVYAQTKVDSVKAEKLKAQLIESVCTCISQSDTSKIKTADDVQGLLMKCFMSNGMSTFMDYAAASGVDMTNMEEVQDWGQKVAMELTFKCPTLVTLLMNLAKNPDELKKMTDDAKKAMDQTDSTKKL